jgi:glycosyltransferase involved in cell wall biosynthesis
LSGGKISQDLLKWFSVVVPVYNCEATLCRALDSVKQQTYRPIELIIVDDGSIDNSLKCAEDWANANQDELFSTKVVSKKNGGACSARNVGIEEISGDYIQFLDSDDILDPSRFSKVAEEFEKDADFVQTGFTGFIDSPRNIVEERIGKTHIPLIKQVIEGKAWANTLRSSMKKTLLDRVGLWIEEMPCFQDRYFMERAILLANRPVVIETSLAAAERSLKGVSSTHQTEVGRRWRIFCEKQLVELAKNRPDIPDESWSAYKSRIYGLALRTRASGWHQLGQESFLLAESVDVEVDEKGRLRRHFYRLGIIGCQMYLALGRLKALIKPVRKKVVA